MPVVKDVAGNISSRDDYWPIALASIVSKVVERILLGRTTDHLTTGLNQVGFKERHSTDILYVIKEVKDAYEALNGSIFVLPGRQQVF